MKILIKVIAVLMLMILHLKCSKVIDEHRQALYVSDYCPQVGICDVGTHVMCMHYDPNRKNGPSCRNVEDFTMTPDIAESLLNIMNGMRSRLARGLENGKKKFPKGYGIFKLEWDPELATLAQVWANQCIYENDMCHATKKFSDPGQVIGAVLFTHRGWLPSSDRKRFKYPGYSLEKAKYALMNTLESWYNTRKNINPDDVLGNRKWNANLRSNQYLQIVQGSATHVGCGTAAYRKIRMNPEKKIGEIYNWVVLICNFSTRLRGDELYATKMPEGSEFTKKCGCPPGYGEDPDCLCYKILKQNQIYCKDGQCKAPVVILPIFTVENAPPHKLIEKRSELEFKSKLRNENVLSIGLRSVKRFKPSLFSKTPTFVLPSRKLLKNSEILNNTNTYLNVMFGAERTNDKTKIKFQENNIFLNQLRNTKSSEINDNRKVDDKDDLNRYERRHNKDFIGTQLSVQSLDANLSDSNSNENIVNLLNEIEIVANNTKLNETQKDIFEKKIQYIYKLFLEKTKYLPTEKTIHKDFNLLNYEQDKLYKFEDQIKTINEYENIDEPINENDHFANTYNAEKGNTYKFKDRKTLNFVDVRNSHISKNNIKNKVNKNMDSISMEDDLLPLNKRQYYQNKLNNLEKKIRQMQSLSRRKHIEARRGDVIPMGLFGSSETEKRHQRVAKTHKDHLIVSDFRSLETPATPEVLFQKSYVAPSGSQINRHARESYEYEKAEFPEFRKRKTKKKHNVIKHKNSHIKNSGVQEKQKFKHKGKKRDSKRFIKTTLKNLDKDSNLSDSEDNDKMTKPVDIIVHIKMKD